METNCQVFYQTRDATELSYMQQIIESVPVSIHFKRENPPHIIVKRSHWGDPSTLELEVDGAMPVNGFHACLDGQRLFDVRAGAGAKIIEPRYSSEGCSGPIKIEYAHQGYTRTLLAKP